MMEKDKEKTQLKLNPLLLEPILEPIFDHLSIRDLNNCVSVCKLWSREAIRANRKRRTVELVCQQELEDLLEKLEVQPDFRLINKLDTDTLNLEDPQFEKLLSIVKPTLSILILNTGHVTLPTLHKLLRLVPNLVRLEIGAVKDLNGRFTFYHQLFPVYDESGNKVIFDQLKSLEFLSLNHPDPITPLSEALKTYPNLKDLIVSNFSVEPLKNFKEIRMPHLEQLTVMNLQGFEIEDKHLEMLMKIKFDCLKNLTFMNIKKCMDPKLFKTFVESHRESLTTLELRYLTKNNLSLSSLNLFPLDLPVLETLRVSKPYVMNMARIFSSLPKLTELDLNFAPNSNWMAVLPKNMAKQEQIKKVSIMWIETKPLEMLARTFCSINYLKIRHCDDSILQTIYANMPQLEFLMCYDSKNRHMTTEGLTGIPNKAFSNDNPVDFRTKPFIANLTKLKYIHLKFSHKACAYKIFKYGLTEISSLKAVTINGVKFGTGVIEYLLMDCGFAVYNHKNRNADNFIVYCGEVSDVADYLESHDYPDE